MNMYFTSGDQLKKYFDLDNSSEYLKFQSFSEGIGFSVQRAYPESSKFSAPKKRDGTPDTYALIKIIYSPDQVVEETPNLVPISANIGTHNRYISNHFDYNFSDEDCPTEESVLASKRTPRPLDLLFFNEYFFNHERDSIVDCSDSIVKGIKILNLYYDTHLATVDKLKGKILRWKMGSTYKTASICKLAENLFKWLLKALCGRSIEPEDRMRGIFGSEYRQEDLKLLKTERIDVFGYRASKNVIVTFCAILIIGYLISYSFDFAPEWLKIIGRNNLLSFALAVMIITILDNILPKILFKLVNFSIRSQFRLISKRFKFK